jgi:hypothetical protein
MSGNHFWNEQRVKNFMLSMELVPTNWDENIAAMAKSGGISVKEFLEMNPVTFGERVFCNTFLVRDIIGRRNYYELLRHRDLTSPENATTTPLADNDATWAALAEGGWGDGGMLASAAVFATSRAEAAERDAHEKGRIARAAQVQAEAALSKAAAFAAEAAIVVEADTAAQEEEERCYNDKRALKGPSVRIADIERVAAGTDMSLEEALNILRNER